MADCSLEEIVLNPIYSQAGKVVIKLYGLWGRKLEEGFADVHSEKAMAPHSTTLAWKTPWMEEPGRLQSMGSLRNMIVRLHFDFSLSCIGEGNGNPLQFSCLENLRDGGAWWAAVSEVAQSQTRLKRLSSSIEIINGPVSLEESVGL